MLAFHGKLELKDQLLNRLQAHYDADEIVKGKYWEGGKGCALGCAMHLTNQGGNIHLAYQKKYGINIILGRLQDGIFEALPNKESKEFPIEFTKAVPVGANLDKVFCKWSIRLLKRVRPLALDDGKKAIDQVIKLFEEPEKITATADADAAAAAYAADAAAYAAYAARAATYAADAAYAAYAADATYAARAAARAARAADARQQMKLKIAEYGMELLLTNER